MVMLTSQPQQRCRAPSSLLGADCSHACNAVTDLSPDSLVRGIKQGDRHMERTFCQRYYPRVKRQLQSYTRDPNRAEDITHDVLLTILLRLRASSIEQPQYLDRFVHQTAKYYYLGWIRQATNQSLECFDEGTGIMAEAQNNADPEQALLDAEQRKLLATLIDSLQVDRDRELLLRAYIRDEPKLLVCESMTLSALHFDRVLHRARQRLKSILQTQHADVVDALRATSA
jgi:RNA polymerase sigma-70 factor, ECF subfamily